MNVNCLMAVQGTIICCSLLKPSQHYSALLLMLLHTEMGRKDNTCLPCKKIFAIKKKEKHSRVIQHKQVP